MIGLSNASTDDRRSPNNTFAINNIQKSYPANATASRRDNLRSTIEEVIDRETLHFADNANRYSEYDSINDSRENSCENIDNDNGTDTDTVDEGSLNETSFQDPNNLSMIGKHVNESPNLPTPSSSTSRNPDEILRNILSWPTEHGPSITWALYIVPTDIGIAKVGVTSVLDGTVTKLFHR